MGASMRPAPSPNTPIAVNIITFDVAWYSINHAMTCGILTMNIDRFRPSGSDSRPDRKLPIGCPMNAMLPIPTKKSLGFSTNFLTKQSIKIEFKAIAT